MTIKKSSSLKPILHRIIGKVLLVSVPLLLLTIAGLYYLKSHPAPDVELLLTNGEKIHLSDFQGQVVLVVFWSTTCQVCIKEMPNLNKLNAEYSNKGLKLIGITMPHDAPDNILFIQKKKRLNYVVAFNFDGLLNAAFNSVQYTPTYILIDKNGFIVNTAVGAHALTDIIKQIKELLNS